MIGPILFIRTASKFGFGTKTWFQEVGACIAWGLLRHLVHHRKLSTAPPRSITRSVIMVTSLLSSALARVGRSAAVLQPIGGLPKRMPLKRAIKRGVRLISGSSGTEWTGGAQVGSTLSFETISDGEPLSPEQFEGKAVLVVNTASLCGLTPQLKDLELVHKRFRDSGLVVLGVPSNDFGGQEPWEEDKIKDFYAKDFGVTFPLTSKTVVIGPNAHPFYAAVTAEFGPDAGPQWNFHKLLVGADGALAGVFGSNLSPLEPDVTEAIEEALPEGKGSR